MIDYSVYEQLIPRKDITSQTFLRIVIVGLLTLIGLLFLFSGFILLLGVVIAAAVLIFVFLFPRFHVEHEYTLVGNEIRVDVIYGGKKRKKIAEINLSEAEITVAVSEKEKETDVYYAASGESGKKGCFIAVSGDKRFGKMWIEPDEKLFDLMCRYVRGLKRQLAGLERLSVEV